MSTHPFIAALAAFLLAAVGRRWLSRRGEQQFANEQRVNVYGTGQMPFHQADAPFPVRYLVAKRGAAPTSIAPCDAESQPFGIVEDQTPLDNDLFQPLNVAVFGATIGTRRVIASGAVEADALVATDAGGFVRQLPAGAGTYWVVGKAIGTATAAGDELHIVPCFPYQATVTAE